VSGVPWLIITGSGLDDSIYLHFLYNLYYSQSVTALPSIYSLHKSLGQAPFSSLYSSVLLCTPSDNWQFQVKDGQSVIQSVSLGVEPHLGLMTRYLLLSDNYGLVFLGHPLRLEDGSVFCQVKKSRHGPRSIENTAPLLLHKRVTMQLPSKHSRRGPHRKHLSFLSRIVIAACLLVRYPATDVLLLLRA
jgi:hypothetical protein